MMAISVQMILAQMINVTIHTIMVLYATVNVLSVIMEIGVFVQVLPLAHLGLGELLESKAMSE